MGRSLAPSPTAIVCCRLRLIFPLQDGRRRDVVIVADADEAYRGNVGAWTPESDMVKKIVKMVGGNAADVPGVLALYTFPTLEDQVSGKWLGGGSQTFLKEVADFFVSTGNIPSARDSYESAVNTGPLEAAKGMGM